MIKCSKCGYVSSQYDVKGDNRYCVNCGAELEEDHLSQSTQPEIPEEVTPFVRIPERPIPTAQASSPPSVQARDLLSSSSPTVQAPAPRPSSPPTVQVPAPRSSSQQLTQTSTGHTETPSEFIIPPVDAVLDEANLEEDEKKLLSKHYQQIGAYFHPGETLITSIPVNLDVPKKGMLYELKTEYEIKKAATFKVPQPEAEAAEQKNAADKKFHEKLTGEVFEYGKPDKFVAALTNDRLLLSRYESKELKGQYQSGNAKFDLMMEIPLNLLKTTDFNSSMVQENRKVHFLGFLITGSCLLAAGLIFFFIGLVAYYMFVFGLLLLFGAVPPGVVLLIIGLVRLFKPGYFFAAKEESLRIRYADPVLDKDSWVKLFSERKYTVNKRQLSMEPNKYWKKINAVYLNKFYKVLVSTRQTP